MKISYNWLSSYFAEPLPSPEEVQRLLTMHSFEVESIEQAGNDHIFDIKVLPDRAHDTLSHAGMAREVSVLTGKAIKQLFHPQEFPESKKLKVSLEDSADTPRFAGLMIENVEVKESPQWMKEFLEVIGQKSINNIVDATNLAMFHTGQPLHAYDRDKLSEKEGMWHLRAEKSKLEEKFEALGNKEYKIIPGMLVIRDGNDEKTLGIAGIKGGKASEISSQTKHIIVEAANFNPTLIRKTSQKLKLRTDASERFEKEINPELARRGLEEFAALVKEIAGSNVFVEGMADAYPRRRLPYKIGLTSEDVSKKLGIDISETRIIEILQAIGAEVEKIETNTIVDRARALLGVPYKKGSSISFDAPNVFDCAAFTSYLFSQIGYQIPRMSVDQYFYSDRITEQELQPGDLVFSNTQDGKIHFKSADFLPNAEIPSGIDHVGLYVGDGKIIHAANIEGGKVLEEDMKTSQRFGYITGFGRIIKDDARLVVTVPMERLDLMSKRAFLVSGNKEDLIEEIGRIYGYENIPSTPLPDTSFAPKVNKELYYAEEIRRILTGQGFSEVMTYAFVPKGEVELTNPLASDKKFMRASLLPELERALKENILNKDLLGLREVRIFEIGKVFRKDGENLMLGLALSDKKNMLAVLESLEVILGSDAFGDVSGDSVEIRLDDIFAGLPQPEHYEFRQDRSAHIFSSISPYPFIVRDLAVFVPEGTSPESVEEVFSPLLGDLLVRKNLFDSFLKTMPDGSKRQSYAWRFVFQSSERTLTDEEVNETMVRIWDTLTGKGFEIR